jgi:enhancing lycopene biosynthesis protein 2
MAKRIGVVLSGCGWGDGSDAAETMLAMSFAERMGAKIICAAPERDQRTVVDHLSGGIVTGVTRNARVEAARLSGGPVMPLAELRPEALDGLLIPGGGGSGTTLSDYADKHELCTVDPDLAKLLKALLPAHKPMGFIGLSALLAARVLGPVAGVRVTLGPKGTALAKHAAVMGADVRPATVADVISDEKARVHTTPGFLAEEPTLPQVAKAIEQLVRSVLGQKPGGRRSQG